MLLDNVVEPYENLRAAALGVVEVQVSGWAVLMRRGMLAWSEACQAIHPARKATARGGEGTCLDTANLEVVQVLAAMVMALPPEVKNGY